MTVLLQLRIKYEYLTTESFIKNNENVQNIAKNFQISFALKRTLDILHHSHWQEYWKSGKYSH